MTGETALHAATSKVGRPAYDHVVRILLAHGAAIVHPEDAQFMLDHTICQGVQLGSSIERMAMERPLQERAAAFKTIHFRDERE